MHKFSHLQLLQPVCETKIKGVIIMKVEVKVAKTRYVSCNSCFAIEESHTERRIELLATAAEIAKMEVG